MGIPYLSWITFIFLPCLILHHNSNVLGHFYNEEGWTAAGRYMREAIDSKADPCQDFYQYACGKWDKKYASTYNHEADKAVEHAIEDLIKAIKSIRADHAKTPAYQKRLQTFYKQCVDATEEEEVILNEIYHQIEKVVGPMPLISANPWLNGTNPYKLMGYMQQYFNTSILISASVEREAEACRFKPILTLSPAKPKEAHRVNLNSSLTRRLFKMMTSKRTNNKEGFYDQMQELADLENELISLIDNANSSWSTYEVDKLDKIFKVNSSIWSWSEYFEGLLPERGYAQWRKPTPAKSEKDKPKPTRITFRSATFFHDLDRLIVKYGAETLLDYAYWRAMRGYLEYFLDTPQYHNKNITEASIERQCVDYVLQYASAAAARLLFDTYGSNVFDWKYDVELIGQAVLSAFRYMIYNADWLDLDDKIIIMNKLKMISIDSGIPDWLLNDTDVEEHTPPFDPSRTTFENDLLMFRDKFIWKMQPLWRNESAADGNQAKADSLSDPEPNFIPYAKYSEQRIEIWLGAILPPLYSYSYPLALKFGAIGSIVGEQLMRAFDPDEISERIGIKKWLKMEAVMLYRSRKRCVALTQPKFRSCFDNSSSTSSESCQKTNQELSAFTADIEGMKLSYMAYAFMTQTVGREPALPGLSDYDADQLYFLGYSRFLCGFRDQVDVALMNFPAFGKAFNCKAGTKFAPDYKCTLWSNVSDTSVTRRIDN